MENKAPAKKPKDSLFRIKHIAYCLSQTPLEECTFEDLVQFAKFQLCTMTKRLMKDPIWDSYTPEEVLVEYQAHLFQLKPDVLKDFELQMAHGEVLDFNAWADLQIKMDEEEKRIQLGNQEDRVTFSPDDVMGGNQ